MCSSTGPSGRPIQFSSAPGDDTADPAPCARTVLAIAAGRDTVRLVLSWSPANSGSVALRMPAVDSTEAGDGRGPSLPASTASPRRRLAPHAPHDGVPRALYLSQRPQTTPSSKSIRLPGGEYQRKRRPTASPDDNEPSSRIAEPCRADEAEEHMLAGGRVDLPIVARIEVDVAVVAHEKPLAGFDRHVGRRLGGLGGAQHRKRHVAVVFHRAREGHVVVDSRVVHGHARRIACAGTRDVLAIERYDVVLQLDAVSVSADGSRDDEPAGRF